MRWFSLDRGSSLPLIRQIYGELSSQILDGELPAGERLPSTRAAAEELSVSRNVVLAAYEQLEAEGYVLSIEGAGTYVAEGGALRVRRAPRERRRAEPQALAEPAAEAEPQAAPAVDFDSGHPALDLLPSRAWSRLEAAALREVAGRGLDYARPEGRPELREALAGFLRRKRGIECDPGQILVTAGAMQGIAILARLAAGRGGPAIVEDPCSISARRAVESAGARVLPVPADEEGLRTDLLPRGAAPSLLFVTPSHQFPLGGCLSARRRVALADYAREEGSLVIEDDYESEFRYDGPPVSALQRLDPDRVAYVGSLSKIFFPALRIGYLVAPEPLVEACREAKRLDDRYNPPAPQLAMARFIEEGLLDRHVARMKKVYRARRDALRDALARSFGDGARVTGAATGLHLVAAFRGARFDEALLARLRRAGVLLHPVEEYAVEHGRHLGEAVLGYSHLSEEEIERGVGILRDVVAR